MSTYPELGELHLDDYKIRILDGELAAQAKIRVLNELAATLERA